MPPGRFSGKRKTMRRLRIIIAIITLTLALLVTNGIVFAVPPLPSSFYGTVTLNGSNFAEGTVVEAMIGDKVISESQTMMYEGKSVYSIDVNGDDTSTTPIEGGKDGDVIRFRVGGLMAEETGMWRSGTNVELNLSVSASESPEPPEPTRTPLPTQTNIVQPTQASTAKATQAANLQPTLTPSMTQPLQPDTTEDPDENTNSDESVIPIESEATPTLQALSEVSVAFEENPGNVEGQQSPVVLGDEPQTGSQFENQVDDQQEGISHKWIIGLVVVFIIVAVSTAVFLFVRRSRKQDSNLLF